MLYSQNIKNMVSGISQQPPILRLPEQLERQINGWSTDSGGLQKRPPTCFKAQINFSYDTSEDVLVHPVNRDDKIKYALIFTHDTFEVISPSLLIGGVHFTKSNNSSQSALNYLKVPAGMKVTDCIRVATIGDTTFVVNKTISAKMKNTLSPNTFTQQGALFNVKSGQYGRTYTIWVNGTQIASYTTPDGSKAEHTQNIDTSFIATQLAESARKKGYTVDNSGSWLRVQGSYTKVATTDGFNNQALIGILSTVQKFTNLPAQAPNGYTVKVKADDANDIGSYYIRYNETKAVWEECVCPNIQTTIDPATMPHIITRTYDSTKNVWFLTIQEAEWTLREAGDDDSNPLPSFIGDTISDVFFFRNRLGLLSGENMILSGSGDYFNFFMETATDVQDTDPIDIAVTTNRVNNLNFAVPYNEELFLFSDNAQFALRSDTVLSPKNCALAEVTEFGSTPTCRPAVAGKNLYFPSERAEYTSIKEYYTVANTEAVKNAQDVSSHVANFIPNGVYDIISNTNENIMFILTKGESNSMFVYKYLFENEQRIQASWSKWSFDSRVVVGAWFFGSTLFLLTKGVEASKSYFLEYMDFTYNTKDFDEEPYRTFVDSKIYVKSVISGVRANNNGINVSYLNLTSLNGGGNMFRYLPKGHKITIIFKDGHVCESSIEEGNIVLLDENYLDAGEQEFIIGIPLNFDITLSPIYIKRRDTRGSMTAENNGRLQIRYVTFNYDNTGGFDVHVQRKNSTSSPHVYKMTAKTLGTDSARVNELLKETGIFKVPIQCLNTNVNIDIKSDSPLPLSLIGYKWEGTYVPKSRGL